MYVVDIIFRMAGFNDIFGGWVNLLNKRDVWMGQKVFRGEMGDSVADSLRSLRVIPAAGVKQSERVIDQPCYALHELINGCGMGDVISRRDRKE